MSSHLKMKKEKKHTKPAKNKITKRKSLAAFFGIDKKEVDGLQYQKKIRNEWN